MTYCKWCGARDVRRRVLGDFQAADLIEAPFPVLVKEAVEEGRCGGCGEVTDITVPNFDGLIATVAVARACAPQKLSGPEIRFLRKAMRWKGTELAEKLSVDPSTVSRWENGAQTIGDSCEQHLRLRVCAELGWFAPLVRFDQQVLAKLKIVPTRDADSGFAITLWLDKAGEAVDAEKVVRLAAPPRQTEHGQEIWASDGLPVTRAA